MSSGKRMGYGLIRTLACSDCVLLTVAWKLPMRMPRDSLEVAWSFLWKLPEFCLVIGVREYRVTNCIANRKLSALCDHPKERLRSDRPYAANAGSEPAHARQIQRYKFQYLMHVPAPHVSAWTLYKWIYYRNGKSRTLVRHRVKLPQF